MIIKYQPDFGWLYAGVAKSFSGCDLFCPCKNGRPGIEAARKLQLNV